MKTNQTFRNVFIVTTLISVLILSGINTAAKKNTLPNKLSRLEIKQGWKLLFDGKSSNGWHSACKDKFSDQGWATENGMLTVLPGGKGGDIVTDRMFSNFELSFDFKAPVNSNSGVKYFVLENTYENGKALGLEYQTHDTGVRPISDNDPHPNTIACLYELIQAKNRVVNPVDEWNNARIVSVGKHVEHWLNGIKVLEYERGGKKFREAVEKSKFKDYANFGEASRGHILLQDHNDLTSFRNIKIREL